MFAPVNLAPESVKSGCVVSDYAVRSWNNLLAIPPMNAPSPTVVMTWPRVTSSVTLVIGNVYVQFVNPPPNAVLKDLEQCTIYDVRHVNSLERAEVRDLLIAEQREPGPEPRQVGVVKVLVGEVVQTLIP